MQEFISFCFGVIVGGFIGFNADVARVLHKVKIATQKLINLCNRHG